MSSRAATRSWHKRCCEGEAEEMKKKRDEVAKPENRSAPTRSARRGRNTAKEQDDKSVEQKGEPSAKDVEKVETLSLRSTRRRGKGVKVEEPVATKEEGDHRPVIKEEKGITAAPAARGRGKKRSGLEAERGVKVTSLPDSAPVVKEDPAENGITAASTSRSRGKKRGCWVAETAVKVAPSVEVAALEPPGKEGSAQVVGRDGQSEMTKDTDEKEADLIVKMDVKTEAPDNQNDIGDLKEEQLAAKQGQKLRGQVGDEDKGKSAASKASRARNKKGLETKKKHIKEDNINKDHQGPSSKRRRPQTKKSALDESSQKDEAQPQGARRKPSSRAKKQVKKDLSSVEERVSERSMDSWVDDVTSELLSEKDPVLAPSSEPEKATNAKFVGAHCSIAGGLWNAVTDAVTLKAKSFALFLRSQRQWHAKPLEEKDAARFREACAEHGFPPHLILPHGSYLLNSGSPNEETLSKSRDMLEEELRRCERLGLTLYNFHPGSTCGKIPVEECLDKIAESINMALEKTSGVTAVLENMSCQGNTIGGRFEELRGIIDRVKDKTRIGVCLDTCHAFAAGYDLSTEAGFKQMTSDFDRIVGFEYLRGVHVNDSKGQVGCHLDRHENIGKGNIGLSGFRRLMNDPRFNNIPIILETPPDFGYSTEIKTLNSLMH